MYMYFVLDLKYLWQQPTFESDWGLVKEYLRLIHNPFLLQLSVFELDWVREGLFTPHIYFKYTVVVKGIHL